VWVRSGSAYKRAHGILCFGLPSFSRFAAKGAKEGEGDKKVEAVSGVGRARTIHPLAVGGIHNGQEKDAV
jgi:hypothetical protein